jgi:hypothetical protein
MLAEVFGRHVPLQLFTDSAACLGLLHKVGVGKARHIRVRELWLQQQLREGTLTINYIPSVSNPADIFTKVLPKPRFELLRARLGVCDPDEQDTQPEMIQVLAVVAPGGPLYMSSVGMVGTCMMVPSMMCIGLLGFGLMQLTSATSLEDEGDRQYDQADLVISLVCFLALIGAFVVLKRCWNLVRWRGPQHYRVYPRGALKKL